jgi:hypothetical protein
MTRNGTLTARQATFLACLMTEGTVDAAAAKAKVGRASAFRWMREDAAFRAEYAAARRQAVEHATSVLQRSAATAAAVLVRIAADREAPEGSRVSAASKVLEYAFRASELEAVVERLDALEQQLGALPGSRPGALNGRH